jgi:SAM-dependent methyltransferase
VNFQALLAGVVDPFDTVDAEPDPAFEERVLLDRLHTAYYPKVLNWFFDLLLETTRPTSVLEVGCGTGHLLDGLAGRLGGPGQVRVAGVDRSEYLATRAAERFSGYDIRAADGGALPFEDASFDLAYVATVLVHAADPAAVLAEMRRVVRPGGFVAVLDQDFETAVLYPGERERTRRVLSAATDFWQDGWVGRRLPTLLRRTGLDVVDVQSHVRIDRTFDRPFFVRIRDWVVEAGFPAADADRWLAELERGTADDEFLFTRNFYAAIGRR